jgi:hypothetical protein
MVLGDFTRSYSRLLGDALRRSLPHGSSFSFAFQHSCANDVEYQGIGQGSLGFDLLSAADVVAGSVGQYFTSRDNLGEKDARVKEGAEKILVWLGHDGLATCLVS